MRILADGNNLLYALWDEGFEAGREGLCRLLGDLAERTRLPVAVVFDGHAPFGDLAKQIGDERIEIHYSEHRSADELLADLISAHTAPRRLTVVSSDHEVVHAGRHRECHVVRSQDFAKRLLNPPPPRPPEVEPAAKRAGLHEGETDAWLKELGLADQTDVESK